MKEECKAKVEKIQQIVQDDISNGREIQKKIKIKLQKKGKTLKSVVQELKIYSHGK